MKKFGLSDYKKVGENESHATFRHPHGHEIHIAKASLRPELKQQLDKIPLHMADGGPVEVEPIAQPQASPVQDINWSQLPAVAPQPAPQANPEAPAASPQQNPQLGAMYSPNTINKIFGQQADALQTGNKEYQGALGQAEAAQKAYADTIQKQQQEHVARLADINKGLDQDRESYLKNNIDPNHVWNSKSTGQKVSTIIGLFLGGIGGGLTHGENPALAMLNKTIDRDIESQKTSLGKQHTLYSMNLQKLQNENAADAATKLQMYNAMQAKLQLSGMKMQGAEAQQRFKMGMAGIEQAKLPYLQQLAQFGMMQQAQQTGIPSGTSAEMFLPEKFQERLVNIEGPNGKMIKVPAQTKEDAEKFRSANVETDVLMKKIKKAQNFIDEKGWSPGGLGIGLWNTEDSRTAKAIQADVLSSIGKLESLNRLSEQDLHLFKDMGDNPGAYNSAAAKAAFNYLEEAIKHKKQADEKNYLSNYSPDTEINFKPRK